jgi:2-oxoglutarate ferredoxin oxidoreductase subunit alpha
VATLRDDGVPTGLIDLKTLWPFPDFLFERLSGIELVLVPELNLGQVAGMIQKAVGGRCKVRHVGRVDGYLMTPDEIRAAVHAGLREEACEPEGVV